MKKIENSATTYYLRSTVLGGQVVAELNSSGQWTRGYVYLGGQMVAIQQNSAVSWVHQDPVTKSQRVTNSSGTVTSTIDLDPWGGETSSSSNQAFQPHRFTTYERDANGGDDAMMRRYAGSWMRFSQPDPYDGSYDLGDPQSFNRYIYVQNDPVNFMDPSGLEPCGPIAPCNILSGPGPSATTIQIRDGILGGADNGMGIVDPPGDRDTGPIDGGPQDPRPAKTPTPTPTPTPTQPCGINPVTGQPGFTPNPINQTGHMRDDGRRVGHGYFGASRGRGTRPHDGIDIRGDVNVTPAVAFLGGTVSEIRNQPRGYGNMVIIDHGNRLTSRYAHLQAGSIAASGIRVGQSVGQGQAVGVVGNTGNAGNTTPHLHFEIRLNNVPTNPATFLNQPCPP